MKALSLLGKQTVCSWAFHMKFQEMRLHVSGHLRSPPGAPEKGGKYTGFGVYHGPLALWHLGIHCLADLFPDLEYEDSNTSPHRGAPVKTL